MNRYHREGCLKIENFLIPEEVEELRKGLLEVENMAKDSRTGPEKETDNDFINSQDKLESIFEKDAFDITGNIAMEKKPISDKINCGLHLWHPIFKKYTFSQKVKDLIKTLQYKDPIVVDSMLNFKEMKVDEILPPHQESIFLYSEPPTCIGLGFPLEDTSLEKGCLWYVPGSHKGDPVYKRFVRNEDGLVLEGKLPGFLDEEFVPLLAKKGDCIVIHGSLVHKSVLKMSEVPNALYLYHMVEKEAKWSPLNCDQPTEKVPFPSLYSN